MTTLWTQTVTGRAVSLTEPRPEDIDLMTDVPHALGRICRYTGHVGADHYSVAQHCVIGAETIFAETGDRLLAAAFLLHDAHEAYLGDIATPVKVAICDPRKLCAAELAFDRAIFAAARMPGFADPLGARVVPHAVQIVELRGRPLDPLGDRAAFHAVRDMDARMLAAERRRLLLPAPRPWPGDDIPRAPVPLFDAAAMLGPVAASESWRAAARKFLPLYTG